MLMGIVDTMFVGRLPNSADAIGASGLGNAIYINIVLLLGGVLLALDTIISQAFGAALLRECRSCMVHGLYIASALTPVITAATFAIIEIVPRCGLTPSVMDQLVPFMGTLVLGHPAAAALLCDAPVLAGYERCRTDIVCADFRERRQRIFQLGTDLREPGRAGHGDQGLCLGNEHCAVLHVRRARGYCLGARPQAGASARTVKD